ncbi:hypothetical protein B5G12_11330 [Faecalibacterium sp. An58]|uniref:hypothetical protein n=1 Tax=Faecalibacterium sp. An58 TaxID=1965648 RepID=UPI000B3AD644|nr:hypothetical protein [Faecalibacterium sp. An58]OUN69429.1 hypothetical protein B5G12_11330 [Faecalibacterium sp. An58]
MSKKKKDIEKEYGLPAGSLECLARTFLPGIQAFFEVEENQKAFEAWLTRREMEKAQENAA